MYFALNGNPHRWPRKGNIPATWPFIPHTLPVNAVGNPCHIALAHILAFQRAVGVVTAASNAFEPLRIGRTKVGVDLACGNLVIRPVGEVVRGYAKRLRPV